MSRRIVFSFVVLALGLLAGCGSSGPETLGVAPTGAATNIAAALARPKGATVTVEGEIIEKCPVAGCWFVIRDATGTVRVDTKQAGFVVVDVPLHAHVTVSATVAANGEEPGLAAVGLRR
jgi:uncharacterized protein YdeI (BOF family)